METMNVFLEKVLPWLGAIDDNTKQEGAIESLACILCTHLDLFLFDFLSLVKWNIYKSHTISFNSFVLHYGKVCEWSFDF